MAPASTIHGQRENIISFFLTAFVRQHGLGVVTGEGGYLLARDPDTVRSPDAGFIARGRIPDGLPSSGFFEGAPDLAVEVLSPDERLSAVMQKVSEYLGAGASRFWVVDQERRAVTVHRHGGLARTYDETGTLRSDDAGFSVDGFELRVAEIFA